MSPTLLGSSASPLPSIKQQPKLGLTKSIPDTSLLRRRRPVTLPALTVQENDWVSIWTLGSFNKWLMKLRSTVRAHSLSIYSENLFSIHGGWELCPTSKADGTCDILFSLPPTALDSIKRLIGLSNQELILSSGHGVPKRRLPQRRKRNSGSGASSECGSLPK